MIANRIAYGETLVELVKENPNVVILDADACKSTGTSCCREQVPEHFVQCGIAEQNMMGIAAGLALQGKIREAKDYMTYVHLVDSNRLYPGNRKLDFHAFLAALADVGYQGWLSVEVFQRPTQDIALEKSAQFLTKLLKEL